MIERMQTVREIAESLQKDDPKYSESEKMVSALDYSYQMRNADDRNIAIVTAEAAKSEKGDSAKPSENQKKF